LLQAARARVQAVSRISRFMVCPVNIQPAFAARTLLYRLQQSRGTVVALTGTAIRENPAGPDTPFPRDALDPL